MRQAKARSGQCCFVRPVDKHGSEVVDRSVMTSVGSTRKGHRYIENLALKEEVDQASMIEEIAGSSEALRKSP